MYAERVLCAFWARAPHFLLYLIARKCPNFRFHDGGRLEPIEMDGLPVLHVVDAVGAVLLAMCRFHGRIACHASAVRRRSPADL